MLTKGAVEDLLMEHLSGNRRDGAAPVLKKVPELGKKTFLSDRELRRLYRPGSGTVSVPLDTIISPLSLDWLDYDGIKVLRN